MKFIELYNKHLDSEQDYLVFKDYLEEQGINLNTLSKVKNILTQEVHWVDGFLIIKMPGGFKWDGFYFYVKNKKLSYTIDLGLSGNSNILNVDIYDNDQINIASVIFKTNKTWEKAVKDFRDQYKIDELIPFNVFLFAAEKLYKATSGFF